ncbi:MAG: type II toxin-antitoxin system VapC family toxin [Granulosicoccaceae bacterium]
MIVIDTNVLLRYLLRDDVDQAEKAANVINGNLVVLISNVVLVETLWTLCGKKYRITQDEVVSTVQALFAEPNLVFEQAQTVWRALGDYIAVNEGGKGKVDFPDALILNIGRDAAKSSDRSFNGFYTFDKAALRLPDAIAP